jgi:hypothetical protein
MYYLTVREVKRHLSKVFHWDQVKMSAKLCSFLKVLEMNVSLPFPDFKGHPISWLLAPPHLQSKH